MSTGVSMDLRQRIEGILSGVDYMTADGIAQCLGHENVRSLRRQLRVLADYGHIVEGPKVANPKWAPGRGRAMDVISWSLPSKAEKLGEPDEVDTNQQRVEWNPAPNRDPWVRKVLTRSPSSVWGLAG